MFGGLREGAVFVFLCRFGGPMGNNSKVVKVRMNAGDYSFVQERAKELGLTMSEYLRSLVVERRDR